jgi:hypothetical protein
VWTWNKTQTQLEKIMAAQAKIMITQAQLQASQVKLLASQDQVLNRQAILAREIRNRFDQLDDRVNDLLLKSSPGPVLIIITGEDTMADLITFNIVLPPVGAPDVVVRELTISIEGKDTIVQNVDPIVTIISDLSGPQGAEVSVSLIDVDDAGNRSAQANASIILADNFGPSTPDQIGFELTGEVHVADSAPEPEAPIDEPVVEEALANDPAPEDPEA